MYKRILFCFFMFTVLWSCEEIIEVEDISNQQVVVLAPVNDATLNNNTLTFSWELMDGADSYHLQIAEPSFLNALQIVTDSIMVSTSFSTTLENKTYEWRIRAENSGYTTVYTTQSFTIEE